MIQTLGLTNSVIGGPNAQRNGIRFQAAYSSPLSAVRCYVINNAPGYSKGDGGAMLVSLCADAGSAPGLAISKGIPQDDLQFPAPSSGKGYFPLVCFYPFPLRKGSWYWIVIDNHASDPVNNYFSMDYNHNENLPPQDPTQIYLTGSGTPWKLLPQMIPSPIVFHYANGLWQGLGWIGLGANKQPEPGTAYGFPAASSV